MPNALWLGCITANALAALTTWWALRPLRPDESGRRRWSVFLRRLPWMSTAVLLALLLLAVGVGLRGYEALTHEEVAGEVVITRAEGEEKFVVDWRPASKEGALARAVLVGDQVAVEGRVLKWAPWANVLGLHTHFAIERVSGRFAAIEEHNAKRPGAKRLTPPPFVDIFWMARALPSWVPVVDASYGSSAFIEADDGGRWSVRVSTSGLLLRPIPAAS